MAFEGKADQLKGDAKEALGNVASQTRAVGERAAKLVGVELPKRAEAAEPAKAAETWLRAHPDTAKAWVAGVTTADGGTVTGREPGSGAVDRLTVPPCTQRYTVRAPASVLARASTVSNRPAADREGDMGGGF